MSRKYKHLLARISFLLLLAVLYLSINRLFFNEEKEASTPSNNGVDKVEVHYIDVGQGDSILIQAGGHSMLIDAGENNKGTIVVNYLKSKHIKNLDYVVGTHPHSDHVGGLDTVIRSFSVDNVILPDVVHSTKTFEDVLDSIQNKSIHTIKAKAGDTYTLGPSSFTILAPNSTDYDDLNNYSVVIKLTFRSTSFLFTGDAEKLSEGEILDRGYDLSADVIKIGHHGSSYSSSPDFLEAVNPSYAVISVGKGNKYGHPATETLQALADRNISVYRTDKQGTVVFTSDGKNISVNTDNYKITNADLESKK